MAEQLFIIVDFTQGGKADLEPLRKPVADAQARGKTPVIVVDVNPMDYFDVLTASKSRGVIISKQGFVFVFDAAGRWRKLDIPDMRYEEALNNAAMAVLIADITDADIHAVFDRLNQLISHDPKVRSPVIISRGIIDALKGHLGAPTALPVEIAAPEPTWAQIAARGLKRATKL